MALYARLGQRLASVCHARLIRPAASFHTCNRRRGDIMKPEGYEHFLAERDLPQPLPPAELTPELREALAAKYNMRPEDYEPMRGPYGDYPVMPTEGAYDRDPYYDWDCKVYRRNFGEPIPYDLNFQSRVSPGERKPLPVDYNTIAKWWAKAFLLVGVLVYLGEQLKSFPAMSPKQYPEYYPSDDRIKNGKSFEFLWWGRKDLVHYGFPPSKSDHH